MSSNTNGFNYYSDYQGHGGIYVVLVLLFLGLIFFGSSFKKDKPVDNSYRDDYDTNMNRDNDYNDIDSSMNNTQSNIDDNVNDGSVNNNVDSGNQDNNINRGMFEIVR